MKTCFEHTVEHQYPVKLEQYASGLFRVTYGADVRDRLDYAAAALELGACLMHALACDGKLENGD